MTSKFAPKRTKFQIESDRQEMTTLYLHGMTQAKIAERMGVSRVQITYDLQVVQKQWRKSTTIDLDEAKRKELAKIDDLERTYWEAWEVSLGEREQTLTEQRNMGEQAQTRASIRKENRDGDPAFLAGVQWCIERRCKLLGLDAPVKGVLTGKDGGQIAIVGVILEQKLQRIIDVGYTLEPSPGELTNGRQETSP